MNKSMGIVFLVVGLLLLGYGFASNDSAASGLSRLFTGAPTDKTIFLLVGGAILSIIGAVQLIRK